MAAIIAQLTRASRGRAMRKVYGTNKCMYTLQPFDPCFDPTRHNKYLVDKQKWEDQVTRNREEREELFRIWRELQEAGKENQSTRNFCASFLLECLLLFVFLATLPATLMATELLFMYGTRYIPSDKFNWTVASPNFVEPSPPSGLDAERENLIVGNSYFV